MRASIFVYSVSVFTHLDERGQFDWLAEVRRVLRPGGVALLTVHGEAAFQRFVSGASVGAIRSAPDRLAAESLAERGFIYEAAEWSRWNALRFIGDGAGWGLAFHSEDYLRRPLGRALRRARDHPREGGPGPGAAHGRGRCRGGR